jgi:transcriptional regulator with XRE-family HTH domain
MSQLAENLRRVMARLGLSVQDVAKRCALDRRTVLGILDGRKQPHAITIHRLSAGLGVSSDEFYLDASRLLYRNLDQSTLPVVSQLVAAKPELFARWSEADFAALHGRVGAGGAPTFDGAIAAAEQVNRNREVHEKLAVLLEGTRAELIRGIVEVMYAHLAADDSPP